MLPGHQLVHHLLAIYTAPGSSPRQETTLPSAQVYPRIHTWPRSGSSWTCIHNLNNPTPGPIPSVIGHEKVYPIEAASTHWGNRAKLVQQKSIILMVTTPIHEMLPTPDRTTNQELRGSPSLLVAADPARSDPDTSRGETAEGMSESRERGTARHTGDGVDTEGSCWLRREAAIDAEEE